MALQFDLNQNLFEQENFSFLKIGKEATSNVLQTRDFKNSKYKKSIKFGVLLVGEG